MRKPCDNCPWRKDAPPGYWHPSHFNSIWGSCQDDGINVMACHKAIKLPEPERRKLPCQGWLRVVQFDAIGVRIAVMFGWATLEEVQDQSGDPPLFPSFVEMMKAQGIKPPRRNKRIVDEEE